jgi:hypothetical protein
MAGAGTMLGCCQRKDYRVLAGAAPVPYWLDQPDHLAPPPAPARLADLAVVGGVLRSMDRAAGPKSGPGPQRHPAGGGQDQLGGEGPQRRGPAPASLAHAEASGRSACAPCTGSAKMRATDKSAGSFCRRPDATRYAARHRKVRGPERSQAGLGDRRAPGTRGAWHVPERSFRRGADAKQANRTDGLNGGPLARAGSLSGRPSPGAAKLGATVLIGARGRILPGLVRRPHGHHD